MRCDFPHRRLAKRAGWQAGQDLVCYLGHAPALSVQAPKLMANEAQGAQVIAGECHKSQVSGRS